MNQQYEYPTQNVSKPPSYAYVRTAEGYKRADLVSPSEVAVNVSNTNAHVAAKEQASPLKSPRKRLKHTTLSRSKSEEIRQNLLLQNMVFIKTETNAEDGIVNEEDMFDEFMDINNLANVNMTGQESYNVSIQPEKEIESHRPTFTAMQNMKLEEIPNAPNINFIVNTPQSIAPTSSCAILLPTDFPPNVTLDPQNPGAFGFNTMFTGNLPAQNTVFIQPQNIQPQPILYNNLIVQPQPVFSNVSPTTSIISEPLLKTEMDIEYEPQIKTESSDYETDYIVQRAPEETKTIAPKRAQKTQQAYVLTAQGYEKIDVVKQDEEASKTEELYRKLTENGIDRGVFESALKKTIEKNPSLNVGWMTEQAIDIFLEKARKTGVKSVNAPQVRVEIIPDEFEEVQVKEERDEIEVKDEPISPLQDYEPAVEEADANLEANFAYIRTDEGYQRADLVKTNDADTAVYHTTYIATNFKELTDLFFQGLKFVCHICGKPIVQKKQYETHVRSHDINEFLRRDFTCNYCSKAFYNQRILSKHIFATHTEKNFECDVCKSRFKTNKGLIYHKQIMHENLEKAFECKECGKTFYRKTQLNMHVKVHYGKMYKCDECGASFNRKDNLRSHIKMHLGQKDYSCSECDKKFVRSDNLKKHMLTHSSERPFDCNICMKKFKDKAYLKSHMEIHKKEKTKEKKSGSESDWEQSESE